MTPSRFAATNACSDPPERTQGPESCRRSRTGLSRWRPAAARARRDQVVVEREDNRGGTVTQLELREQVVDVRLDRSLADEQVGRDLGVALALPDERQHFTLPGGQVIEIDVASGPLWRSRPVNGQD